ncbi:competence protein ComEA helix-hairpin-helix repeat protein [Colwellia psychrerythraea]|uniref:Competence protein ComEA helix-hairpin-helix repeat protein n=2 Tax=Colwellia psychrerythraea TaxID=28229 RepID=A0A099KJT5_COLPS|nr:competence protein ComEA helix-hairpin-helix repeat protein [Colwellia psychrerythraea]
MKNQLKVLSKALFTASLAILLSISTVVTHAKDISATQAVQTAAVEQQAIVNINKSTFEQLVTLKGIGETKAQAIIVYRQQIGAFKSISDLTKVSGIGEKVIDQNKTRLSI